MADVYCKCIVKVSSNSIKLIFSIVLIPRKYYVPIWRFLKAFILYISITKSSLFLMYQLAFLLHHEYDEVEEQ